MKTQNAATIKLSSYTTSQLIELWIEIDKKEISIEVATVRGWIMDALEAKDPEAFDKWMDNCDTDEDLHHYFG